MTRPYYRRFGRNWLYCRHETAGRLHTYTLCLERPMYPWRLT